MSEMQCIVFRVAGQDYAADVRHLHEVISLPAITPLPRVGSPIVGVFNLRGRIVTAVDGSAALGLAPTATAPTMRVLVARQGGHDAGIIVESASEVLRVPEDAIQPSTVGGAGGLASGIVIRAGRAPVVLLDVPALLERCLPQKVIA